MATHFLKTREFGDCGEFRGIAERVCLDQCRNDLSQQFFPMSFESRADYGERTQFCLQEIKSWERSFEIG